MANRSNEPRDLEIFIEKKNYFVLSLPFSLFFKDVFLIKSSNDAAKTVITLKISEEKVVFLV